MLKFLLFYFLVLIDTEQNITRSNEKEVESLKIVLSTNLPPPKKLDEDKIKSFGNHKALLGYLNAYFYHCPIKVNPNVIWQLILNAFSEYVNDNSEILRSKFVEFQGKKDLVFHRNGTFDDIQKYESGIIEELCQKISEYIGGELTDILTPNFSTSTNRTIIAGKASIMSTYSIYFHYGGVMHVCGIPYIILEGKLSDWEKIFEKLIYLSKYDFKIDKMKKNIEEIINTKKGNINLEFWKKIIMETKENILEEFGTYSYKEVEKKIISGWICDFYPTMGLVETNLIDSSPLVDEILEVPLKIKQYETKEVRNYKIYTGITDLSQDPNSYVIEPIVNYSLFIESNGSDFDDWIPNDL
jgi:hypothetical protein